MEKDEEKKPADYAPVRKAIQERFVVAMIG